MPFISGTANTTADIVAAVKNACAANGWAVAGDVIYKGVCYVSCYVSGAAVAVRGGLGIDGSNVMTGLAPTFSTVGPLWSGDTFTGPYIYNIHINTDPDEVYVYVNYELNRWLWLAFGRGPAPSLPGTGNWAAASGHQGTAYGYKIYMSAGGGGANNAYVQVPGLFWASYSNNLQNGFFHHGLDGFEWSGTNANDGGGTVNTAVSGMDLVSPLLARTPNVWNNETLLVPINLTLLRASTKTSIVGAIAHARYTRNNYYNDGEVMTIGPDRWKIYPCHQKNSGSPDACGGNNCTHTGTFAHALRYDGP